ncbi:MAG: hypothetical protein J6T10_11665 [Methanobrevibacter sp.]|nr:hypothetical protein [Methanobrevibacter sp.]
MEHEEYTAENYPSFGKKYNGEKAIISLTSWKARINTVSKTLFSLLKQCPGFHIVLVLSEEEFPKMMDELPEHLKMFAENELIEILWVYKNYKSFKKVLFTMDKYRTVPVISADDDCIYTCNYAQMLYDEWIKNPECNITNDGMPYYKNKMAWGRGPNTLYSLKFNFICDKLNILNVIKTIKYYEDDSFYGTICKKYNIKYIDLHKKSFYIFHTKIKPLHDLLNNKNYITYYNRILKCL